jgi:hypothetical protein
MYKFWRINRWVHQYYDLPLKKFLDPWRDKLIQHFYNNPPPKGLYNVICNIDEVNSYLDNIFSSVIENYYNIDPTYKEKHINLYIQNDNNYNSVWHNHTQGTSTITGVIYISPPEEGGGLEIHNAPFDPFPIPAQENVLTLFPSWLNHRPLPQKDKKERICINISYSSYKRPVHKISGDLW